MKKHSSFQQYLVVCQGWAVLVICHPFDEGDVATSPVA